MSDKEKAPMSLEDLLKRQNEIAAQQAELQLEDMKLKRSEKAESDAEKKATKELHEHKRQQKVERDTRTLDKEARIQSRCNHLKGKGSFKILTKSYNLYAHQLTNGDFFIGCLSGCRMKWYQGDTAEFLQPNSIRGNKNALPNPTRKSFEDMWALLEDGTISRSEVAMQPRAGAPAPVQQ